MDAMIQSNADAGLNGAGLIMVSYLWLFLAILSRSGYERAPRFASIRGTPATYSSRPLYERPLLLYFEVRYLSVTMFHGFSHSKECSAFCRGFNLLFLKNELLTNRATVVWAA
jgi:hypothetical protein